MRYSYLFAESMTDRFPSAVCNAMSHSQTNVTPSPDVRTLLKKYILERLRNQPSFVQTSKYKNVREGKIYFSFFYIFQQSNIVYCTDCNEKYILFDSTFTHHQYRPQELIKGKINKMVIITENRLQRCFLFCAFF